MIHQEGIMELPRWVHVHTVDEMEAQYRIALPKMREAARKLGWALGVHGSMRRDLDLIAAPWIAEYSTKDELAKAMQIAACGMSMAKYQWSTDKPCGRTGTVFAIMWCEWHDMISAGCVDLSVMPDTALASRTWEQGMEEAAKICELRGSWINQLTGDITLDPPAGVEDWKSCKEAKACAAAIRAKIKEGGERG